MNDKNLKKRIVSVGLATIIGATSGVAIEKGLHSDDNNFRNAKTNKELTVVWNDEDVNDFSFVLGGLVGRYDYLNDNKDDYTKNSYYEKYYEYLDLLEYISGYKEGYQNEGMFMSYENNDSILEQADKTALVFETMVEGSVRKQYVTTEPDRVVDILQSVEQNKTRS